MVTFVLNYGIKREAVGEEMEFFAIAQSTVDMDTLKTTVTIENLPRFCASIEEVLENRGGAGRIFCLWGEFEVRRETVNGGVRFTLPSCPNSLAWTVTTGHPTAPDKVVVHCTINRTDPEAELVESIETFLADWKKGLERELASGTGS